MRNRTLLLLFGIILIELLVFVKVSNYFNLFSTILGSIITTCIGISTIRHHGISLLNGILPEIQNQTADSEFVFTKIHFFLAGSLLVIPGFFTDLLGILLLLPITRKAIKLLCIALMQHLFGKKYQAEVKIPENAGPIIDGDYRNVTRENED